jgi:enamine deaminase RidA (YjgF/YER057c/UK114 family)
VATSPVNPPLVFRSLDHGFSQAVVASGRRTLYVSGQVAWDAHKRVIGGADLDAQARQAFVNLRTVVEAAGATLADVAIVRIYVVDYRPEKAAGVGARSATASRPSAHRRAPGSASRRSRIPRS